jgi:bifunctional non-homologous end joining protein LigD
VGGYRALGHVVGGGLVLRSRNGVDVGGWFPELAGLAGALGDHAGVLDGEWSPSTATAGPASGAAGADGQPGRAEAGPGVTYLVFDLVWLDGRLLTGLPYTEWRRLLEELEVAGPAWQTVASFAGAGTALLEATREQGLEGWWPSGCRASTCRAGGPGTGSRPSTTSVRRSWSPALSPTGTR